VRDEVVDSMKMAMMRQHGWTDSAGTALPMTAAAAGMRGG
jgi:hypothetical protein